MNPENSRFKKTEAIVLSRTFCKESSCIADVITSNLGKIRVFAQGICKEKSSYHNMIHPLNSVELTVTKSSQTDLFYLKNIAVIENTAYELDYNQQKLACLAVELFKKIQINEHESQTFYDLLLKYITYIKKNTIKWKNNMSSSIVLVWRFYFKVFELLGIALKDNVCYSCKVLLNEGFFDFNEHSYLCKKCISSSLKKKESLYYISRDNMIILNNIRKINSESANYFKIDEAKKDINQFITDYFFSYFDTKLNIFSLTTKLWN